MWFSVNVSLAMDLFQFNLDRKYQEVKKFSTLAYEHRSALVTSVKTQRFSTKRISKLTTKIPTFSHN